MRSSKSAEKSPINDDLSNRSDNQQHASASKLLGRMEVDNTVFTVENMATDSNVSIVELNSENYHSNSMQSPSQFGKLEHSRNNSFIQNIQDHQTLDQRATPAFRSPQFMTENCKTNFNTLIPAQEAMPRDDDAPVIQPQEDRPSPNN